MVVFPSLQAVLAILLATAMFVAFARGKIATEIVSLVTIVVIALGLYLFPLPSNRPEQGLSLAFAGFGHPALVTICALMVMGRGLVMTGGLEPIVHVLGRLWRANRQLGMLSTLLFAFGLSMVINDTPVLVLLLPVLVQLATQGAMPSSKTLMPINSAVLIGGMATTIGTSTNLLVVSIARDQGLPPMSVFHFTPIVATAAIVALPYLWFVMPRLLPDNSRESEQHRRRFTGSLRVGGRSGLVGKTIAEITGKLPADLAITGYESGAVEANSRLTVTGTHDALEEATRRFGGSLAPVWLIERLQSRSAAEGQDLIVVEMAVTADSRIVGHTVATSGLAERHGAAILGVDFAPRGPFLETPSHLDAPLSDGDVLLVMTTASDAGPIAAAENLLRLDGARIVPRRSKALLALAIMGLSIASASLGVLPISIAALIGAIIMFATGCVRFENAGRALSAQVIVLVAASIAMGRLILESGAAGWLGQLLAAFLQFLPPAGVLAFIMIFVTFLTNFASNAAAATVGTPIAINVATALGMPAEPLVLAVLFGCNLCYATPVAYQTNMLIMAEGGYAFRDYVRAGVPLAVLMIVTLSILLTMRYQI
jgi:di/tricarboxylate transporter